MVQAAWSTLNLVNFSPQIVISQQRKGPFIAQQTRANGRWYHQGVSGHSARTGLGPVCSILTPALLSPPHCMLELALSQRLGKVVSGNSWL